jgi:hypothetical protein
MNVQFEGQTLVIPGAYYADNVSAVLQAQPPTSPPLIFIGYGYGTKPQTANTYIDPNDLLAAIRGGPCSGFVPFLTNPSPNLNGAQQITFINVGENTQSALELYAGATGATSGVASLISADYGLPSNLLQIQVQAGSTAGVFITLYDAYSNIAQQGDDLGVPFLLAYLGAASAVAYTVAYSGGVATSFNVSSSTSGESVTIPLSSAEYGTVQAVVEYLNGTGLYSAIPLSSTNGQLPAAMLDNVTSGIALPVPVMGQPQYVDVTASMLDPVYWINNFALGQNGNPMAIATATSGVVPIAALLPNVIPFTSFSGAVSVPPVLDDYANAFNLALTLPAWSVFADSNSSGVIALGTQHALTASETVNAKWRRFFTGSSQGASISTAVTTAQAQASSRTTFAYPGIYANDPTTGVNTLFEGLYVAAMAAGMATGNPANMPLTNKQVTGTGVELSLGVDQINELQQAGVMPIYIPSNTPGIPTIASDFTTWQNDANPANVFNQQIACRDFTAYTLVNAIQPYAGGIAAPNGEVNILRAAQKALNALVYTGTGLGVLASWDSSTLQIVYTGINQTAALSVNITLVGQNRFITIFVPIQPLNFTTTLTNTGTAIAA